MSFNLAANFNLGKILPLPNLPRLPGLPPLPTLPGLPSPHGGSRPQRPPDRNEAQSCQLHQSGAVDLDNVNLDNDEKTALVNYMQLALSDGKFTPEEQKVYQDLYRLFARGKGGNPTGGSGPVTSAPPPLSTPRPAPCPPPLTNPQGGGRTTTTSPGPIVGPGGVQRNETDRAFAQLDRTGNGVLSGNEIPPDVRAFFPGKERITREDFMQARGEAAAVRRDEAEFNQRNVNGDGWLDGSEARGVEHLDRGNNFISNGREYVEISKEEFMRGRATERAQQRFQPQPRQAYTPRPQIRDMWYRPTPPVVTRRPQFATGAVRAVNRPGGYVNVGAAFGNANRIRNTGVAVGVAAGSGGSAVGVAVGSGRNGVGVGVAAGSGGSAVGVAVGSGRTGVGVGVAAGSGGSAVGVAVGSGNTAVGVGAASGSGGNSFGLGLGIGSGGGGGNSFSLGFSKSGGNTSFGAGLALGGGGTNLALGVAHTKAAPPVDEWDDINLD